jgi:ABC-type hemin transport system substrate-binding protein
MANSYEDSLKDKDRGRSQFEREVIQLLQAIKTNTSDSEADLQNISISVQQIANFLTQPQKATKLTLTAKLRR